MAVDFPTNLISNVMLAAGQSIDPVSAPRPDRSAAAPGAFQDQIDQLMRTAAPRADGPQTSPATQLEAFFIGQLFENLLPKDSGYYGDGFAGDMWRSMMAEQLADVVTERTSFGIAAMVDGGQTGRDAVSADVNPVSLQPADQARAYIDEQTRNFLSSLDDAPAGPTANTPVNGDEN